MNSIIYLNDNITNGFVNTILEVFTITSILCGVFVIASKNPIVSVLFLIGLFLNISVYLMVLGINFIGLSYLLVYVGAVSILFLFILMLINVRISEIVTTTSNSIPLSVIIGVLFFSTVYKALPYSKNLIYTDNSNLDASPLNILNITILDEIHKYYNSIYNVIKSMITYNNNVTSSFNLESYPQNIENYYLKGIPYQELTQKSIALTYSQDWDSMLAEVTHINTIGNILYTSFPLWILLTSLILLLAMVGAILITLKN